MIFAKVSILLCLALPIILADQFLQDVYNEHNRQRRLKNLPALGVDGDLEKILQRLGYNGDGHNHGQKDNLQAYAARVTGLSGSYDPSTGKAKDFKENWAYSGNKKHTAKALLEDWMGSRGHRATILDSRWGYMGCGIGRNGRDYTYTCAFIRDYKDGCYELSATTQECDGSKRGLPCISTTKYFPSC